MDADVEADDPPKQVVQKPLIAESEAHAAAIAFAVAGYATCSSLMLVVNKVAVYHMPSPSFVLLAQLVTSAIAVWVSGVLGFCQVDALEWSKVKAFFPVAVAFLGAIFTNIKTLQCCGTEPKGALQDPRGTHPDPKGLVVCWFYVGSIRNLFSVRDEVKGEALLRLSGEELVVLGGSSR